MHEGPSRTVGSHASVRRLSYAMTMTWDNLIEGLAPGGPRERPHPHKALLLIYLLKRAADGESNGVPFEVVERDFGPWLAALADSEAPDARLPFWHLQGDGGDAWRVEPPVGYELQKGKDRPTKESLRQLGARGVVAGRLWEAVAGDRKAARATAVRVGQRWLKASQAAAALGWFDGGGEAPAGKGGASGPWVEDEYVPLVAAYMAMLEDELAGRKINKAEVRRGLMAGALGSRSNGSIEMKMQNVSAVLHGAGLVWIQGYKPLGNAQGGLFREAVLRSAQENRIPRAAEPTADRDELDQSVRALLSLAALIERPPGNPVPPRVLGAAREEIVRDPNVTAYVLQRAQGTCERCSCPAPFHRKSDGTPYLEVHHLEPLADGGADTVENACAVCPNCHREMHFGEGSSFPLRP